MKGINKPTARKPLALGCLAGLLFLLLAGRTLGQCNNIEGISARAGNLRSEDLTALEGWETVRNRVGGNTLGYLQENVERFFQEERIRVLGSLNSHKLAALRAYAVEYLPEPSFSTFGDLSVNSMDIEVSSQEDIEVSSQEDIEISSRFAELVPKSTLDYAVTAFDEVVRRIRNNCQQLDLSVQSIPKPATFRLFVKDGTEHRSISTDGSMRIYRGLYNYALEKSGHKTIAGSLNLVDDPGSRLTCKLILNENPDSAYPCTLE